MKAKKIIIGLFFSYDENWIGGSYYILNLIQSLNLINENIKPKLVIISNNEDDFEKVKELNYPYIKYKLSNGKQNIFIRIINKISRKFFFGKNLINRFNTKIDVLFPATEEKYLNWIKYKLFWIPDFQEHHLPHFFPEMNLVKRREKKEIFSNSTNHIVFSSEDVLNDYQMFFPNNKTQNHILNFAVFHPDFRNISDDSIVKYGLSDKKYFFSPNQFWKHKNQIVILKALVVLKKLEKLNFVVAFSGKEFDHRNPNYFQELTSFVSLNNLQENVKFLGFIDRKEQLFLMNSALAIIQPSLFEGWSTVVEDAKKLNQNCIVSNLEVHKEQLKNNAFYFDPINENELAEILFKFSTENILKPNFNYQENSKLFGQKFMEIIDIMMK